MRREDKYPETECFVFDNVNPSNRFTNDCVIRAIAGAAEKPWDEVFDGLCELAKKYHEMPNDRKVYGRYLERNGWVRCGQPRWDDGSKYTGKDFVEMYEGNTNVVAHIGGHHMVCIKPKDGKYKIHDTWDSSGGCVGVYWMKED